MKRINVEVPESLRSELDAIPWGMFGNVTRQLYAIFLTRVEKVGMYPAIAELMDGKVELANVQNSDTTKGPGK